MDGLAGGIGLIAAVYLALLFHQHGDVTYTVIALAIAGAVGGFLLHNFYPASLFMGDAGSLFLGASLSLLTVQANGQASTYFPWWRYRRVFCWCRFSIRRWSRLLGSCAASRYLRAAKTIPRIAW